MIPSQFNLDHRLAELRQAGADSRVALARSAAGQRDNGIVRSIVESLRSLIGGSAARGRTRHLAAR